MAYKLKKGQWIPSKLRVTSFAVERLDAYGEWTVTMNSIPATLLDHFPFTSDRPTSCELPG